VLTGERLDGGVDTADRAGVDVDADDVMTRARELDGERQADLAEPDDGDSHAC